MCPDGRPPGGLWQFEKGAVFHLNPHCLHLLVTKRRKGRPDKERDPQAGVRSAGYLPNSPFLSQQGSIVAVRRTGGSYGGKGDLSLFRESGV